ncbi:hypothetical protein NC653_024512 [Populus alba x Populus x berolinensis]|uniref:Uncharacterized protein n=1 Tax=Populus alba x Populus x berolinensis TaxID=444605 RepID=A0AAD6M8X5_9ROSI|nr:hypothetical protein NC653_024512 [Populus alba x Populus x berolinensis]
MKDTVLEIKIHENPSHSSYVLLASLWVEPF